MSQHTTQHVVADMLQGYIQILADVLLLAHHSQQVPREVCRIGIVQANPLYTFNIGHTLNEFSYLLLTVEVDTIVGQLLSNHIKLLDTLADQPAHLVENLIHRTALMLTRDDGNGTVGTMAVAAFCNLQVGIVARSSEVAVEIFWCI